MSKILIIPFLVLSAALAASAATIRIHGSSTMAELNGSLSKAYQQSTPGTKVESATSDSTQGIADLIAGKTDIAAASRQIKPEESAKAKTVGIPVARDGVVIYVHPSNKLTSLTMKQIGDIFSGRVKNWSEVGGSAGLIKLYVRESNSGTAEFFREHVLGSKTAAYGHDAREAASSAAVISAVSRDAQAIGYAGVVSERTAKPLSLKKDAASPPTAATRGNVISGKYPLARVLYYYVPATHNADVQKFVQWVLSPAGQQAVTKAGFFAAR